MSKPNYQTSLQFTEADFKLKERLKKAKISIIATWRAGAELKKKSLTK